MISATTLKAILDRRDYPEAIKYCNGFLSNQNGQEKVQISAKIINQIAYHLFNTQCSKDVIQDLIGIFSISLTQCVDNHEEINMALCAKLFGSCYHVLGGRIFKDNDVDAAVAFLPSVSTFAIKFRHLLADSELHDRFLISYLKIFKTVTVSGENGLDVMKDSCLVVLKTFMLGTKKTRKDAPDFSRICNEINTVLRSFFKSVRGHHIVKITGLLSNIFDLFQNTFDHDLISKAATIHNLSFEILGLESILLAMSDRHAISDDLLKEAMKRYQTRLEDCHECHGEDFSTVVETYREKYSSFLYSIFTLERASEKDLALFIIHECQKQVDILMLERPHDVKRFKADRVYSSKCNYLLELGKYEEAAHLSLKLVLFLGSNAMDPSQAGNMYLTAKKKMYNAGNVEVASKTATDMFKATLSKEEQAALGIVEVVAARKFPDLRKAGYQLLMKDSVMRANPYLDVIKLIEAAWRGFFFDSKSAERAKVSKESCSKAISIMTKGPAVDQERQKMYLALAKFWLCVSAWNEGCQLTSNLLNEVKTKENSNEEEDDVNIRKYGSFLSLDNDLTLLGCMEEVMRLVKEVHATRDEIFYDVYISSQTTILPMLSIVCEYFKHISGRNERRKCLNFLSSVARMCSNRDAELIAMSDILRMNGSSSSSMKYLSDFTALLRDQNDFRSPLHSEIGGMLATAWFMYKQGDSEAALHAVRRIYGDEKLNMAQLNLVLLKAECCLLAAKCRCNPKSSSIKVKTAIQQPISQPHLIRQRELQIGGPIEIGTTAVKLSSNTLKSILFCEKRSSELDRLATYFRASNLVFETRMFLSEVYNWSGLPLERKLLTKLTLEAAIESGFATSIVDALFLMAETALITDEPIQCKMRLKEIEEILGQYVCHTEKGSFKKPPSRSESKDRILIPNPDTVCSSPKFLRPLHELPKWLSHESSCKCPLCDGAGSTAAVFGFVVKFFTFYAVVHEMEDDQEASDWMFNKASMINLSILMRKHHLLQELDSEDYHDLLAVCFHARHWHIETLGQRSKLDQCHELTKSQVQILKKLPVNRLNNYPIILVKHWEHIISIQNLLASTAQEEEPEEELVHKMANLLNPPDLTSSAFKTPMPDRSRSKAGVGAPLRKNIPGPDDIYVKQLPKFEVLDENAEEADVEASSDSPPKQATKTPAKARSRRAPKSSSRKLQGSDSSGDKPSGPPSARMSSRAQPLTSSSSVNSKSATKSFKVYEETEPSSSQKKSSRKTPKSRLNLPNETPRTTRSRAGRL